MPVRFGVRELGLEIGQPAVVNLFGGLGKAYFAERQQDHGGLLGAGQEVEVRVLSNDAQVGLLTPGLIGNKVVGLLDENNSQLVSSSSEILCPHYGISSFRWLPSPPSYRRFRPRIARPPPWAATARCTIPTPPGPTPPERSTCVVSWSTWLIHSTNIWRFDPSWRWRTPRSKAVRKEERWPSSNSIWTT